MADCRVDKNIHGNIPVMEYTSYSNFKSDVVDDSCGSNPLSLQAEQVETLNLDISGHPNKEYLLDDEDGTHGMIGAEGSIVVQGRVFCWVSWRGLGSLSRPS